VICPTGKFSKTLSSPSAKNFWLVPSGKSTSQVRPSRAPQEGRIAIVTNVGCGMRWTPWLRTTNAVLGGRRSRVVLTPRRWCQVSDDCFGNRAGDGGNKARFTGESTKETVQPSRRECRFAGSACSDLSRVLLSFAREAMGAGTRIRYSLRPLFGCKKSRKNPGEIKPREGVSAPIAG
jgi:hypothetical protein